MNDLRFAFRQLLKNPGFTAVAVLTGIVFGTVPAWIASRSDVNNALKESSRGTTSSRSQHRLRHTLIIGEVALALVLLTGAGLFVRGLQLFTHRDPGWRVDGLLTGWLSLPGTKYERPDQQLAFFQRLEERLVALPGVERRFLRVLRVAQICTRTEGGGSFVSASTTRPNIGVAVGPD